MKRKAKGVTRLMCGCVHDGDRWLIVCPADRVRETDIRRQWHKDCSQGGEPFKEPAHEPA